MEPQDSYCIDATAARALADWKAYFSEQVSVHAKELAMKERSPGVITLDHYRRAAIMAAQMLVTAINDSESANGDQKAADCWSDRSAPANIVEQSQG